MLTSGISAGAGFCCAGERGFIGPIGDDLPSLIPLLFGLVMFFAAFTATFSAFDARNAEFNDEIAIMRVSRVMQSTTYIYSHENFRELCGTVGILNVNFVAGISDDATNDTKPQDLKPKNLFDVAFFAGGQGGSPASAYVCSNTGKSALKMSDFLTLKQSLDYKVVSRIFPIAVEDNKVVKPMHLFVVAWK